MKLLEKTLSLIGYEKRAVNGDGYWSDFAALRGATITPATAEALSAVTACVSAISESVASLPLMVYRRNDDGREKASDHPLYRVLHDSPNEIQTALEFREQMTASMLLHGNGYARIVRGNDGQVRQLLPIHSTRVRVIELDNGRLGYEVGTNEKTEKLVMEDVFHLKHRSDDGLVGISPIQRCKQVLELASAEMNHGTEVFSNGAKLLGILKAPGRLNTEQREAVSRTWKAYKSGGTAILTEGMDFSTVSMSLEDAEWIAARQFSTEEICRLFRCPPTVIGDLRHGNYSNSVEMSRQFVTMTLKRHLTCWEQSVSKQLLTEAGRRTLYAEHSVESMLRGDSTTRAAFYHSAIDDGWMTVDEVRQLENLPKLPANKFKPAPPPKGAA